MGYATEQNCIDRYGEDTVIVATDRDGDGSVDSTVMSNALSDADATIDSYVSGLPGWPFDPTPDSFERIACDLALYYAAQPANAATESQRQRYEDAIQYLRDVGTQKIRLPQVAEEAFVASDAAADIVQNTDRVFTRTKLGVLF